MKYTDIIKALCKRYNLDAASAAQTYRVALDSRSYVNELDLATHLDELEDSGTIDT